MTLITSDHLKALQKLDWTRIKYFYYIAKLGSFTKAAKFLDTTQPGLSRQIGLLEKELNCRLFYREIRGVSLTRKGEELYKVVELHFINLKAFNFNHVTMSGDGKKRKIRLVTTYAVAAYILTDLLVAYKQTHPHITFEVLANDQELDLTLSDADMMISLYNPNVKGIEQELLFTAEKKLFASQKYIEKYGEPQTVEDLNQHQVVAFQSVNPLPYSDIQWILRLGMPSGELREPCFTSNSFECLIEIVQAGEGIMSSYAEFSIIRKAGFKRLLLNLQGPLTKGYLCYHRYLNEDEELVKFKNYLLGQF